MWESNQYHKPLFTACLVNTFWVTDGQNKTNLFPPWRKQGRWGGQDKHLTSWLRNGHICWRVAPRSCDLKRQTNKINKTKQKVKQNSKCPNSVSESIVEKKGENDKLKIGVRPLSWCSFFLFLSLHVLLLPIWCLGVIFVLFYRELLQLVCHFICTVTVASCKETPFLKRRNVNKNK